MVHSEYNLLTSNTDVTSSYFLCTLYFFESTKLDGTEFQTWGNWFLIISPIFSLDSLDLSNFILMKNV